MRSKLILLAGALLLLPAGAAGFLFWKAQLTIDGFQAETRRRRAALACVSRGPLWDPIQGSAREEYLAAGGAGGRRRPPSCLAMPFTGSDDLRKPLQGYLATLAAAAMKACEDGRVDEALESLGIAAGVAQDLTRLGEIGFLFSLWRRMIESRGATVPPSIERMFLDVREAVYRDVEPGKFKASGGAGGTSGRSRSRGRTR